MDTQKFYLAKKAAIVRACSLFGDRLSNTARMVREALYSKKITRIGKEIEILTNLTIEDYASIISKIITPQNMFLTINSDYLEDEPLRVDFV